MIRNFKLVGAGIVAALAGFAAVCAAAPPAAATDAAVNAASAAHSQVSAQGFDPLGATEVLTDSYEPNDSQGSARAIGLLPLNVPCSVPTIFINQNGGAPANFFKADGVQDLDFYTIQLPASAFYTVQVRQNSPNLSMTISLRVIMPGGSSASASGTNFDLQFFAPQAGTLSLELLAANPSAISSIQNYLYGLAGCSGSETLPTATPTATPTRTPTPTPTLTPTPNTSMAADAFEPNNTPQEALVFPSGNRTGPSFINIGQTLSGLNFYLFNGQVDTADWFQFYARSGSVYQITTSDVKPGIETVLAVFFGNATDLVSPLVGTNPNNRFQVGVRGSQVVFQAPVDGFYWIKIVNLDASPRQPGQTYNLSASEILINTPTPTPAITRTPYPGSPDRFDLGIGSFGNGSFEWATLIAPDFQYDALNFVPFNPISPNTVDNDFFRLPVKQGVYYTCETLNLAPGVDTNIIIYNSDQVGIGGNDDISAEARSQGKFNSRFSWLSSYTGNAYVLVGEVNPVPAAEAGGSNYALLCKIGLPATVVPTATTVTVGSGPPAPPVPQTPTPIPTPRPIQLLSVRPIDRTTPVPTQAPTPTPRIFTIETQIFNDINRNGVLDLGEGVNGVSVRLSDEATGAPLGQSVTDPGGRVRFAVQNDGPIRVTVPLFGYSALVTEPNATIRIGLVSEAELPQRLP